MAIFIDSSPQVVFPPLDLDNNVIEMPLIYRVEAVTTNMIGIGLSKFSTPLSDGFISNLDASIQHHFLGISEAAGEGVVQLTIRDDLDGETVSFVGNAHPLSVA
ncbi:hypothetical protein [Acaryochloris sp. IP29b_bin.148]|uniref:hypothetical protein n=1 Tax=Acaryochloris sp. IP29b_bin.148 TaxID=2969218 RepID=UPI00262E5C49|nr:hypothetical protein [Acaryochloris sp. IP29b_bin.148]